MKSSIHRATILAAAITALFYIPASHAADGQATIYSTGVVTPKASAKIGAKIMSTVTAVRADTGDRVKKGDVVIQLDDAEFMANVKLAEGHLADAKAVAKNAKKQFERIGNLKKEGSATERALDDAHMAYERANAGVTIAKAELAKAKIYAEYTMLKAPFDGVVDDRQIELGELTQPGVPLFMITNDTDLRFETTVKESDINKVTIGAPVSVLIDALPNQEFSGTVAHIVSSGDVTSHSFIVRIDLQHDPDIKIGMYGKARWR